MQDAKPVLEPAAARFAEETRVEQGRRSIPDKGVEEFTVAGGPSGAVQIRLVRPDDAGAILPVIVYLHGEGWVSGDARTHDRLVRELGGRARAAVVFVCHTPSPEARYPVAVEECYAALEWVAAHGGGHGLDPARIAIAGDSAGGAMAAAVTLMAKQRSGPTLAAQVLFYPVTDAAFGTGSYGEFATGHGLTRDAMRRFWDRYAPGDAARAEITCSPLRATAEQLAGLPPALIIVAEADVLRDEGEAYAAKLRSAGVPVTAVRYQGTIHDFVTADALRDTHAARSATVQAGRFLADALS
ncbi:alpha/beta hydrolase [Winogradskya humida]|uniref:Esterase n=1 Tax=Winogradskya humida TaxID=113566 RepID=A0ABQ3ZIJ2_9ACTN|nr:alpha/beta hydrolase [Actinoplanes humidus]GIE18421.1 esterase [Actinoplanes humidus]